MGEIVEAHIVTHSDTDTQRVIQSAHDAGLEGVVIMGYDKKGEEYFASSYADGAVVLWLVERLKQDLMDRTGNPN